MRPRVLGGQKGGGELSCLETAAGWPQKPSTIYGEKRKLPQEPENVFKKVLLIKLQAGQPLDSAGSLDDWVPVHLRDIRAAMQAPTHDALKVDVKTITATYDGLSIQCVAERRPRQGVRLMPKVNGPDGKISQAGSYAFPLGETGCCSEHAHLYLDMLRLLAIACQHQKADLDQVRA